MKYFSGIYHYQVLVYVYACMCTPNVDVYLGSFLLCIIMAKISFNFDNLNCYRNTSNATLLNMSREIIELYFPDIGDYEPTLLVIATWDNVGHYDSSMEETNTFQTLLITNGINSFVIFLYSELQWTVPDPKPPDNNTVRYVQITILTILYNKEGLTSGIQVGVCIILFCSVIICSAKAGIFTANQSFSLPGSGSEEVKLLNETSNIHLPGVHLYRVDDSLQNHKPGIILGRVTFPN